ncbi:hypothetical protein K435DRAFT_812996, partial [Dendrothele bispora CBS 962.96]
MSRITRRPVCGHNTTRQGSHGYGEEEEIALKSGMCQSAVAIENELSLNTAAAMHPTPRRFCFGLLLLAGGMHATTLPRSSLWTGDCFAGKLEETSCRILQLSLEKQQILRLDEMEIGFLCLGLSQMGMSWTWCSESFPAQTGIRGCIVKIKEMYRQIQRFFLTTSLYKHVPRIVPLPLKKHIFVCSPHSTLLSSMVLMIQRKSHSRRIVEPSARHLLQPPHPYRRVSYVDPMYLKHDNTLGDFSGFLKA